MENYGLTGEEANIVIGLNAVIVAVTEDSPQGPYHQGREQLPVQGA